MTWIALLRGINVGGRHSVPMKDLRALLEDLGYADVRSYIQSGNVVFEAPGSGAGSGAGSGSGAERGESIGAAIGAAIGTAIEKKFGFNPSVLVLNARQFAKAIDKNPYDVDVGKTVHFFFCATKPKAVDYELLESLRADSESYELIGNVFYVHTPDGFGTSKMVEKIEKAFKGVAMTARNLNTVRKIAEML